MEEKSIEQQVREIVAQITGQPETRIVPQTDLVQDLNADSLDCIEIIMELEDVFSIEIDETETDHIKTFAQLVSVVTLKV